MHTVIAIAIVIFIFIAKGLASTLGWNRSFRTCTPGDKPFLNNATGFSAVPVGSNYGSQGLNFNDNAYICSSTQVNGSEAYDWAIYYINAAVYRHYTDKGFGRSVRCVRD